MTDISLALGERFERFLGELDFSDFAIPCAVTTVYLVNMVDIKAVDELGDQAVKNVRAELRKLSKNINWFGH